LCTENRTFFYLILVIVFLISAVTSSNRTEALKYVFALSEFALLLIALQSNRDWVIPFLKGAFVFSGSHVFFSVLYYINPTFVNEIRLRTLSPEAYEITERLYRSNLNAGISPQTGNNAYYISVFIGICYVYFLKSLINKKTSKTLLLGSLLVLAVAMLIATGKRGPLLAVAIALVILTFICFGSNRLFWKNSLKIGFFGIIGIVILINTEIFKNLLDLIMLKQGQDFSSGRGYLWNETLAVFYNQPFSGQGLLTMRIQLGLDTHNVFIQLLAETGLLGFSSFLLFVLSNLIISIKKIFRNPNYIGFQMSFFFQAFFICYCFTGNPIYNLNLFLVYMIFASIR
jgi:O-antigen ligase